MQTRTYRRSCAQFGAPGWRAEQARTWRWWTRGQPRKHSRKGCRSRATPEGRRRECARIRLGYLPV